VSSPALFLDRDGTIVEDIGILSDPEDIHFLPGVIPSLQRLANRYRLFVVTNQVWVARGELSMEEVERVNGEIEEQLRSEGIEIEHWYVCPHEESDNCGCRKPSAYFLREASRKYDIDLSSSFMMGDHPSDPLTARAAGAFGLYLLTGHGMRHLGELPEDIPAFHTLPEAADWILAHPSPIEYIEESIRKGAEALRRGELAVFPTETVYGLGADARNPEAVARIFEAKERPLHDPLIVHVASLEQVESLVPHIPEKARRLMEEFWPGPLTLVLPKDESVPDIVTAGKESVAIRMPSQPLARRLIAEAGVAVAAPSANLFGRTSPTTARHVEQQLAGSYTAIIDGGTCRVGVESTVLSLSADQPLLLRAGGLAADEIEHIIGPIRYPEASPRRQAEGAPGEESPGLLPDHYAPVTPLKVVGDIDAYLHREDVGKLIFSGLLENCRGPSIVLSPEGSTREAAVKLYHAIQELDALGLSLIVAERAPDRGLGHAINDRLQKASIK